jgi:hypothetical protein
METADYYCPTTTTTTLAYGLGRGARLVQTTAVQTINPLKAGSAVAVVWGGVVGLINARRYRKGELTKRDAVVDTAGESVGMGLASGLGLVASNAVRTASLAVTASPLVPFVTGVLVTLGAKSVWNCSTHKHLKCRTV